MRSFMLGILDKAKVAKRFIKDRLFNMRKSLVSEQGKSDKMSLIITMIVILVLIIVVVIFKDDILRWLRINIDPRYWDLDTPE